MSKQYTLLELVQKVDVIPNEYDEEEDYKIFKSQVYTLRSHDDSFNLGYIIPLVAKELELFAEYLSVDHVSKKIKLDSKLDTVDKRDEAIAYIASSLRSKRIFDTLLGWRDEKYVIYDQFHQHYFHAERAICPILGVVMYGVYINGYVEDPVTKEIKLWVPRRSPTKSTYPGMLDNTVAGGVGHPYTVHETFFKECYEEAGFTKEYVSERYSSIGTITYMYQVSGRPDKTRGEVFSLNEEGHLVQCEVAYIYDLKMDPNDRPNPIDGEAEDFKLLTVDEVLKKLKNGEFKPNCGGVIIDFLIRHGVVTNLNEKDYLKISQKLHRVLPFPLKDH